MLGSISIVKVRGISSIKPMGKKKAVLPVKCSKIKNLMGLS